MRAGDTIRCLGVFPHGTLDIIFARACISVHRRAHGRLPSISRCFGMSFGTAVSAQHSPLHVQPDAFLATAWSTGTFGTTGRQQELSPRTSTSHFWCFEKLQILDVAWLRPSNMSCTQHLCKCHSFRVPNSLAKRYLKTPAWD